MTESKLPFYAKFSFGLISIALILTFCYISQDVLIPVLLALLISILLRPIVNFFNRKLKFPHVLAVVTTVILGILFVSGIIIFVSWQINDLANDWEKIQTNFNIHYHNIQIWINKRFGISYTEQQKYIDEATKDSFQGNKDLMGSTLSSFTGLLFDFVIIPFYCFLFLIYRNLFIKFLSKLFKEEYQNKLQEILFGIKYAVQSFLVGLLIEMAIVATLTSLGFMIVGIKYAVLLGVITGILNIIPYIGILFAAVLSIVATLTGTTDLTIVIGVVVVNGVVQLIDNNILVPMIVSSKVKINALVSIIGIITGGAIAGVSGMFLAIPLIAIIKVIFDKIESLEPWGFLMGDDLPKSFEWRKIRLPAFDAGSVTDTEGDVNISYKTVAPESDPNKDKNHTS